MRMHLKEFWDFLVLPWLRLHTSNSGGEDSIDPSLGSPKHKTEAITVTNSVKTLKMVHITKLFKIKRPTTQRASLIAQLVKNPPAMQETLARFPCQDDALEKGQATHSSILGFSWWLSW